MVWSMNEAFGIIIWIVIVGVVGGAVIALLLSLWFWLKKRLLRKRIPTKLREEVQNAAGRRESTRQEFARHYEGITGGERSIKSAVESEAVRRSVPQPSINKPDIDSEPVRDDVNAIRDTKVERRDKPTGRTFKRYTPV